MRLLQEQMRRIHETKNPAERSRLLREHMQTMVAQMLAMRSMGGGMMHGMMGRRAMAGGMRGRGTMGGGMMGGRAMGGGNTGAMSSRQRQRIQDRLDMMQMMMEQMMGQMQAMEGMYMSGPRRSRK